MPVQSGSDAVLGDMKREYCREDFEHVVNFLREKVPGVTIATDIICGFPTETEDDFEETMTLCEQLKFPSLFINQYFPRPGTPAALMKKVPADQVKKRTKRLTELFYTYEPYGHKVGQVQTVLATEISHDKKHLVAHNKFYEQVLLPMEDDLLGKEVQVKILSATKFSMMGEILHGTERKEVGNKSKNEIQNKDIGNGFVFTSDVVETNGEVTNDVDEVKKVNPYMGYAMIALLLAIIYRYTWVLLKDLV